MHSSSSKTEVTSFDSCAEEQMAVLPAPIVGAQHIVGARSHSRCAAHSRCPLP